MHVSVGVCVCAAALKYFLAEWRMASTHNFKYNKS